jgi:hypothetical protein
MVDDTRFKELTLPEGEPWMSHGFVSKIAAQVSLPYRRPKDNAKEIVRRNGNLVVRFISGEDCLPYGKYPRLFELWACTMIKTNNPCFDPETNVLHLGTTFREFLRMIDVQVGGRQLKSIKPQLERLFACSYHISNNTENETNMCNFVVAEKSRIDWLRNEPQAHGLFENWVQLSQGYVNMLRDHPVPVDLKVIARLRKPMAIDVYWWLTKRVYNLHEPVTITWQQLYQQFGNDSELRKFKENFRNALAEVTEVYPCRVTLGPQRVTVFPNRTSVPTVAQTRAIERSREDDTKRSERERRNAERAEERRARAESRAEEQRQREEIQRRVSEERKRHGGSMFAGSAGYVEGEPDETGAEDDVWHDPDEMTLF